MNSIFLRDEIFIYIQAFYVKLMLGIHVLKQCHVQVPYGVIL